MFSSKAVTGVSSHFWKTFEHIVNEAAWYNGEKNASLPETEIKMHSKVNSETWAWQGIGGQKEKIIYCLYKKKGHTFS